MSRIKRKLTRAKQRKMEKELGETFSYSFPKNSTGYKIILDCNLLGSGTIIGILNKVLLSKNIIPKATQDDVMNFDIFLKKNTDQNLRFYTLPDKFLEETEPCIIFVSLIKAALEEYGFTVDSLFEEPVDGVNAFTFKRGEKK